ncbi:hypothetical protein K438DRAFT_1989368 [Mycena galopus ATCC 62051]|nr:hypothetical protein K438DRAFT_1989368 [Mycena galopus ATCC 62051]
MASLSSSSRLKSKTKDEGVECTAQDTDAEDECDCTEFRRLKNSTLCRNCLHEEKDHLGQSSSTKNVENILAGLVKSAGSDSRRTLGSIAKARAGLATAGSRSSKASSSSSSKAQAANEESNEGMRPQSRSKGKGKKKSTQSTKFRVSSIMVLPCGTKLVKGEDGIRERQLPEGEQGIPDRVKIQKAVLRGHAVLQTEAGIELDRTDDHDELTQAFRQQLPYPFAYFSRLEDKSDDPAWWLATVVNKQLQIVPTRRPTGTDAEYNKGASTSGFRHSRLFIVSSKPIPQVELDAWVDPVAIAALQQPQDGEIDSESELEGKDLSPSPEPHPRWSKRRSDAQPEDEPGAKRNKEFSSSNESLFFPEIFGDSIAQEIDDSYIDLTGETAVSGGPSAAFVRPATPPPKPTTNQTLSPEFKVDPSLGNPYATRIYDF